MLVGDQATVSPRLRWIVVYHCPICNRPGRLIDVIYSLRGCVGGLAAGVGGTVEPVVVDGADGVDKGSADGDCSDGVTGPLGIGDTFVMV